MNEPQPYSPRRRLQELLDIPERLRTDEQWDEINELEISLNPVNRAVGPDQNRASASMPSSQPKSGAGKRRKVHKKPFRIPPKEVKP